ncbi:biotin holocarboxylase synthetase [Vanrija albida]|uniref:Biotin holocarboxylase synthetase n=1 Tax=Vanrija albida TaxID=181172 RepID=A0ABR3PVB6_9TREE
MPGPGPSPHQVFVYSGPGVSPLSLSHTLLTLSLQLLPHYTVQPITAAVLATEPWEPTCALLVIPGGRDLPFVEELSVKTKVTRRIAEFVQEGGRYLGICAGAYFGAAEVKFDVGGNKEVVGKRDLAFFPGAAVGPTYPGFDYGSEAGARAVGIVVDGGKRVLDNLYYNGGGHFILPAQLPSEVEVIARYAEPPSPEAKVAAVQISKGKGKALLCAVHFEYPLQDPPSRDAIAKLDNPPDELVIEQNEKDRKAWVGTILSNLGLRLPSDQKTARGVELKGEEDPHLLLHPTHPSPIFVFSHPSLPELATGAFGASSIHAKLKDGPGKWETLRDANDQLEVGSVDLLEPGVPSNLAKRRRTEPEYPPAVQELSLDDGPVPPQPPDFHSLTKTILLPGKTPYSADWTPLFNIDTYWAELDAVRKRAGRKTGVLRRDELSKTGGERPAVGDLIFYGETVTSTQTMLDRNPILLNGLPAPLTFTASFQLSGRGRGSNVWLSPPGCLQYTILLTLPANMANKMIFIQYLAALAICEAVDDDGRLGVRIKWPNDIYAEVEGVGGTKVGGGVKGRAKLGGILVNTNYVNGQWRILVGCGVNVLNALPTTSISTLHDLLATRSAAAGSSRDLPPPPSMEGTFARIMHSFELKWEQFLADKGFDGFMDEYHSRWLHSGQEVTLTTVTPHQRLRIQSITPDHGLLRCVPLDGGRATTSGLSPLYDRDTDGGYDDRTSKGWSSASSATQYVDLQPDGNSFDLMSGMIKKKV